MKKIVLFGLVGIMAATSANAGWLDSLGFGKKKEPATLGEACNKDEITKFCPETLLGDKTLMECLVENTSSLSDQCSKFVKTSTVEKINSAKTAVTEKVDEAKNAPTKVTSDTKAKVENIKKETKAKVDAVKDEQKAKVDNVKKDVDAKKAAAKAQKDEAAAAGKEITDTAKQTGNDLAETGKSLKGMF